MRHFRPLLRRLSQLVTKKQSKSKPLVRGPLTEEEIRAKISSIPYWFHQIEVAPGIFTPGVSNTLQKLERFEIPKDLTGKRVLDIGCFEGFFTFECERRGAEVVAIDVIRPGPDSGFSLAHEILGSKAIFHEASIYDLDPEKFGTFDLVLCLGVIYHLRHPLLGLERARLVCKDKFIVETQICDRYFIDSERKPVDLHEVAPSLAKIPMVQFYPGDELNWDSSNWWSPNLPALDGMLRTSGFIPEKYIENGSRACVHCKIA